MEKFSIVVLPKSPASRAIAQLQPVLRKKFWQHLDRFAENPVSLSEPAGSLASEARGQFYRFQIEVDDAICFFALLFKFADTRDENTILLINVQVRMT
jgi:hypothetical protein